MLFVLLDSVCFLAPMDLHTDNILEIIKYLNVTDLLSCRAAISQWSDPVEIQLKKKCRVYKISKEIKDNYKYLLAVAAYIQHLSIDYTTIHDAIHLNEIIVGKCCALKHLELRGSPPSNQADLRLAVNSVLENWGGADIAATVQRVNTVFYNNPAEDDMLEQLEPTFFNLESLSVTNMKTTGSFLNKLTHLKSLTLRGNIFLNMKVLYLFLAKNTNLRTFELQTGNSCDIATIIPYLSNIVQLKICVFGIQRQNISNIGNLAHLTHLDVNAFDVVGLNDLLAKLPAKHLLERLGLYLYGPLSPAAYASFTKMTNLKSLSIAAGPRCMGNISIEIEKLYFLASTLIHLEIEGYTCNVSAINAHFVNIEHLKLTLDLHQITLDQTDTDMMGLAKLQNLKSLHLTLKMVSSFPFQYRSNCIKLIEALAVTNRLESLILNTWGNASDGFKQFTKLKVFKINYPIEFECLLKMQSIKTIETLDIKCATKDHWNTCVLEEFVKQATRLRSFCIRQEVTSSYDADLIEKLCNISPELKVTIGNPENWHY